jgi:hypothetical protein
MRSFTKIVLALSLTAFFGACGGGNKGEATTPETNPCAEANPCAENPCAENPCGEGDMPADDAADDDDDGEGDGAVEDDM